MSYLRLSSLVLVVGCATSPSSVAVNAPTPSVEPPPMPSHMLESDLAAFVDHRVLGPADLPIVARGEPGPQRIVDGKLTLTDVRPIGWTETAYVDGGHRIWVIRRRVTFHAHPDQRIPANRPFSTTFAVPDTYTFGGVIQIVDGPDQLPTRRAPQA